MTTGLCTCSDQFFGAACEYSEYFWFTCLLIISFAVACPTGNTVRACSGNGRCMSMYELSKAATSWNGDEAYITYGTDVNNPMTWDAHRVFGCHCDDGWTGYDCSLRRCPTGDDPGTHGQVNELQLFRCSGDSGTFRLKFRRTETTDIPHNASATEIEAALENLSTITDVDVAFTNGNSVCSVGSSTTTSIQFVTEHGDLPPITADTSNLHDSSTGANGLLEIFTDGEGSGMETSMKGTTEDAECSNRGICDRGTGVCQCFDGYSSSDGRGNKGRQGDCGHRELCNAGWCNL